MSLLQFLRVIEHLLPPTGRGTTSRKRRLTLESLERRSMLSTLEDALVSEPVASEEPLPLEPAPTENAEPTSTDEPQTDDPENPPVGQPPVINSLEANYDSGWVWFTGSVSDADGPVEGLTVYFTIGTNPTVVFTATVQADGSFMTMSYVLEPGTVVSAYTIDVDGNYSAVVSCTV